MFSSSAAGGGVGMYSTKHKVHAKADMGKLSLNAATKKGDVQKRDRIGRFEGKQFSLPRSDQPFSQFPFTVPGKNDPYCSRVSYRNATRKLGFGSSDPPKRDEFSNTIAIEQYREAIKSVNEAATRAAKKMLKEQAASGDMALPTGGEEDKQPWNDGKEETFEYDQAHSVQPDIVGKPRTWNKLNQGALRTTCTEYGRNCERPSPVGRNARSTASATFYNNNHLRVGHDDH
mmetsp:Transcript_8854/g.28346  ORF Transcript_8854/g.28346 Transcript_8854/m.28346 type:complete len:231 (-) Transcript_8854:82-774(-)